MSQGSEGVHAWRRADTDWFRDCKWGVFTHYLTKPETTADEWNARVDRFDAQGLADQLVEVGARYYFITLGQGSGHYCAPNETYDRLVGITPSKCSRRNLVSDLHEALALRDIALMVYVPADGSWGDPEARKGLKLTAHPSDAKDLEWKPGEHWAKFRLPEFQRNWEDVCRDWSRRFGAKVRGWWVDGAYWKEQWYPEDEPPNLRTYAEALKAGNPEAIVAFNPGVTLPVLAYSAYEDYTAGELAGDLPLGAWGRVDNPAFCNYGPVGRFVDGEQYHLFSFLGPWWGAEPPRFSTELVTGYTRYVNEHGGVVTWDVPITDDGRIPAPFVDQLRAVGEDTGTRSRY